MTLDPSDYDPAELEGMLEEDDPGLHNGSGGSEFQWASAPSPEDTLESNQYRELLMLQGMGADTGRPYLDGLPESYGAELVVFEWLDFLLTQGGVKRTIEALRYYESVGWLSESAEDDLEEYILGLGAPDDATAEFDREDHSLSLVYVARLAAMDD